MTPHRAASSRDAARTVSWPDTCRSRSPQLDCNDRTYSVPDRLHPVLTSRHRVRCCARPILWVDDHGAARRARAGNTASTVSDSVTQVLTMEEVERLKSQALRVLQEAGAPSREAVVVRGDPAAQILRVAVSLPAGLIVMASHGRTGFAEHDVRLGHNRGASPRALSDSDRPADIIHARRTHLVPPHPLRRRLLACVPSRLASRHEARGSA